MLFLTDKVMKDELKDPCAFDFESRKIYVMGERFKQTDELKAAQTNKFKRYYKGCRQFFSYIIDVNQRYEILLGLVYWSIMSMLWIVCSATAFGILKILIAKLP